MSSINTNHGEIVAALKAAKGETIGVDGRSTRVFYYASLVIENDPEPNEWIVVPIAHCDHPIRQIYIDNIGQLRQKDLGFIHGIKRNEDLFKAISIYNSTPGRIGCFINVIAI